MNFVFKIVLWWYIISIPCVNILWFINGIIKSRFLSWVVEWTLFILSLPSMFGFALFMFDSLMLQTSNWFLQICICLVSFICILISLPAIIVAFISLVLDHLIQSLKGNFQNEYNRET